MPSGTLCCRKAHGQHSDVIRLAQLFLHSVHRRLCHLAGRLFTVCRQHAGQEALAGGLLLPGRPEAAALIRREAVFGDSRLDFYIEWPEVRGWMEVKGVTLEEQGVVRFPDAPTERGRKHLRELSRAAREGWYAAVVFVIQMEGVSYFTPHRQMDPAFADALEEAVRCGVAALAYDCTVEPDGLTIRNSVEVVL